MKRLYFCLFFVGNGLTTTCPTFELERGANLVKRSSFTVLVAVLQSDFRAVKVVALLLSLDVMILLKDTVSKTLKKTQG